MDEFFITFGVQFTGDENTGDIHPYGFTHKDYVVIEAPDLATAQAIATVMFGTQYAFAYDREHFIDDGTKDRWYKDREPAQRFAWKDTA